MTPVAGAPRARVFLIDSHDIFRHGMQYALTERDGIEVVGATPTIDAAGPGLAERRPHVVLVGIRLHEDHVAEQLPRLRRLAPAARVLVLTRRTEDHSLTLLRAGASATLGKDVSGDKLASAVIALAEGRNLTSPATAAGLAASRDAHAARVAAANEMGAAQDLTRLTSQERKILSLIGLGLSNREIAERLYLAEKTVRNHVTRLLAKLGVARRTQAALIAVRAGADLRG